MSLVFFLPKRNDRIIVSYPDFPGPCGCNFSHSLKVGFGYKINMISYSVTSGFKERSGKF